MVACELRSYREAIAAAFRLLRPNVEVFEAEDEDLEQAVGRIGPDLVVCSRLTAWVEHRAPNWVELYPNYGPHSFVSVRGERSTIEEIQLSDLLLVLDLSVLDRPVKNGSSGESGLQSGCTPALHSAPSAFGSQVEITRKLSARLRRLAGERRGDGTVFGRAQSLLKSI